jgi:hypothetical protein
MVYLGLYIMTFLCGFYDFLKKNKAMTILLTGVLFLFFFFFAGFRYQTGWDWQNYTALFKELPLDYDELINFIKNSGTSFETGYVMVNYWVKLMGGNVQWIFAMFAFLSIGIFWYALPRYTPYVFVTLLIYLFNIYYLNFSYIRQGFSVVLFFYSLQYIKEKNFKKYLFFTFISFLFHSSSVIALPLYFVLNRDIKGKYYVLCLLLAFALMQVGWLQFFIQILTGDNLVAQKFLTTADKYGESGKAGISSRFIEFLFLFTFCAWNRDYFKERLAYFNIILNCTFVYLLVYLLFNELSIFVERIGILFIIGPTLLYGFVFEKLKERTLKVMFYLVIALIILLRGISFFNIEGEGLAGSNRKSFFPYRNYLIELLTS